MAPTLPQLIAALASVAPSALPAADHAHGPNNRVRAAWHAARAACGTTIDKRTDDPTARAAQDAALRAIPSVFMRKDGGFSFAPADTDAVRAALALRAPAVTAPPVVSGAPAAPAADLNAKATALRAAGFTAAEVMAALSGADATPAPVATVAKARKARAAVAKAAPATPPAPFVPAPLPSAVPATLPPGAVDFGNGRVIIPIG